VLLPHITAYGLQQLHPATAPHHAGRRIKAGIQQLEDGIWGLNMAGEDPASVLDKQQLAQPLYPLAADCHVTCCIQLQFLLHASTHCCEGICFDFWGTKGTLRC